MPSATSEKPELSLSAVLPPIIFGTATFNSQYNSDPYAMPTTELVHEALKRGIRAFDTSPYYGPSEELLGRALDTSFVHENFARQDLFLLTKCGRISSHEFDYSPEWVRKSVARSLQRLHTPYLDVVYCHDVEFVSAEETLAAVSELRKIRADKGTIKYVGISGYPVSLLCERAEMILEATGEPLDVVMSYCNFTLQNTRLLSEGVPRLRAAQVSVVPNASVLSMGLLRRGGVPVGSMGDWHPAPKALRNAALKASKYCDEQGDKIEKVAIRYSIENWMREGSVVGAHGDPAAGVPWNRAEVDLDPKNKLGVSVIGVSNVEELDETLRVWHSILDSLDEGRGDELAAKAGRVDREWGVKRRAEVQRHADEISRVLGEWYDYAWPSPDEAYVREREQKTANKLSVSTRKQLEPAPQATQQVDALL